MLATLASRVFGALVQRRDWAYASGRLGVARLPAPVLSVGNLTVGGNGKTPMVIALAAALAARGVRCDVLTRGYRRPSRGMAFALSGDEDVDLVGDEPRLIAQRARIPVAVFADRFRAGLEAERRFHSQIHLLDDGFQHRQLARAFDLVLVGPGDLDDRLLPAGRLREPPAALRRAHAVVWAAGAGPNPVELAAAREALAPFTSAPVFLARKRALAPAQPVGPCFAFCALARPESFWRSLEQLEIAPVGRRAFRDHHGYRPRDLRHLRAAAAAAGASQFVTTAKDAMKLPAGWAPIQVIEITMDVPEMEKLVALALAATLG